MNDATVEKTMSAKKILFLSDMCVLDRKSGAAICASTWMRILSRVGYRCHSVTMSLFDGDQEVDMKTEFSLDVDPLEHVGSRIRFSIDGIAHNVFSVGTSRGIKVKGTLPENFIKSAAEDIRRIKPDIVFGYGSSLLVPLRKLAGSLGATRVFYLANGSYVGTTDLLSEVDRIVCPSRSLADYYKKAEGLNCDVLHTVVPDFSSTATVTPEFFEARRKLGFVTMINPAFAKGGMQFLQVANICQRRLPETKFLCVESRGTREELAKHVNNLDHLSNIWWLPKQVDMKQVFRRTSILLVPSLWFEAAGRVISEAQLCGIPVFVNDVGGTVEQLNGGGTVFRPPIQLLLNHRDLCPPDQVEPWVQALEELLFSTEKYLHACKVSLQASEPFKPVQRELSVRQYFKEVLPLELAV